MVQILEEYIKKKKTVFPVFSTWSFQSMLGRMDDMSDSDPVGICHNETSTKAEQLRCRIETYPGSYVSAYEDFVVC